MKKLSKSILLFILLAGIQNISFSQDDWIVPDSARDYLSIFMFDEEYENEGEQLFSTSCVSCHGTPTQGNFMIMSPPPGDVASEVFQQQKDGSLFYKIQKGRGTMPKFEDALSEEEIWNLVAYIRSFNENYQQVIPDLEGIYIPKLSLSLDFDDNVDKLVVKVKDENNEAVSDATVSTFIEGMFGNYLVGKTNTKELGIAYFDIDTKIPGDSDGNIQVIVKARKGYGSAKISERIQAATPTVRVSAIEGRHLWSNAKNAPLWLIITFNLGMLSIWGSIVYILFGLRKIKRLK